MANDKVVTGEGLLHFKDKLADVAISNDYNDLDNKLIAGENITISDTNVISASGGSQITIDTELSTTSENPVQNKIITNAIAPVIGSPIDPTIETINYVTSTRDNPPIYDWSTENYTNIMIIPCKIGGTNYYLELGINCLEGSADASSALKFGLGEGWLRGVGDAAAYICLASNDGNSHSINMSFRCIMYNTSGTIVKNKTESGSYNIPASGWATTSYQTIGYYDNIGTEMKFKIVPDLCIGNFINLSIVTGIGGYVEAKELVANITFNGEYAPSPWVQLNNKVTTLENKDFKITITGDEEQGYTSDKTFTEIETAIDEGKNVYCLWEAIPNAFFKSPLSFVLDDEYGKYFNFSTTNVADGTILVGINIYEDMVSATMMPLGCATDSSIGLVQPDNETIVVDDRGVISFNDEIKTETFNLTDFSGHDGKGTITIYQWYNFCWSEIVIEKASSGTSFMATGTCSTISVPSGKMFSLLKDVQGATITGMVGGINSSTQLSIVISNVNNATTIITDVAGLVRLS